MPSGRAARPETAFVFSALEKSGVPQLAEDPQDCGRGDIELVVEGEDATQLDRPVFVVFLDLDDPGPISAGIKEGLIRGPRGRSFNPSTPLTIAPEPHVALGPRGPEENRHA